MTLDPRTSSHRLVRGAAAWLAAVNARHPWDHNAHFHRWVVRRVPRGARVVLDVGCGAGALVGALRGRAAEVHGVDADPGMVAAATARHAGDPHVTVRLARFDDVRGPGDVRAPEPGRASPDAYDAVTMVAVLHHLELEPALRHARDLLAPGGRLLVVGLARVRTGRDLAVDLVSAVLNPLVGLVRHPRRARPGETVPWTRGMPVRDPEHSVDEIARVARAVLPGARVRRRLFFRWTLAWTAR